MRVAPSEGFSTLLRRRGTRKHFERLPLLEALVLSPGHRASVGAWATPLGAQLLAVARDSPAHALARLGSRIDGLEPAEAATRLARDGPNEVRHEPPAPGWLRLWRCYFNPFNLLLTALAMLSFVSADARATLVIGAMVALSTTIRFVQVAHAVAADSTSNAFQAGVNSVSWLLIRFAAVMVPAVFLVNGFTKDDWLQAFLFSLSVAVGLTLEMLPMIVTSTLAKGAVVLSRKKVVVKRLDAIQNLGAMDILCTDKTGTLTQDKIALARHTGVTGRDTAEVLHFAFLNSCYQTGLKNLLDREVLEKVGPQAESTLRKAYRKIDEIPFDFERRRMSVVVAAMTEGREQHHELICKGAVEDVLAVCTRAHMPEAVDASLDGEREMPTVPLDGTLLARTRAVVERLNTEGLRVVAVAVRALPAGQTTYVVADEAGLTLIGYIAFLDPAKESSAPALTKLAAYGVGVKVLTGDNDIVARHVCRQVGLPGDRVLLGSDLEAMDEEALKAAAESHSVFARLTPLHKERIVRALRAEGHVVGFMGDGINDAAALRAADVGISVDSGVDIAKEAADVILLEKSLLVLVDGVVEGRITFCNMLKYIRMTASSNFGNVLSVLVASAFLPFLPMLPLQLLVQNLLYDIGQTGIPFDNVDDELVAGPLTWDPSGIGRFMVFFGPISSLFDILTFSVMWWVFHANSLAQQALFQSGWFVEGLLTQTLVVHMLRTLKLPFVQSRAAWPLMAMTTAVGIIGLWLPVGGLSGYFQLQSLPAAYYGWLNPAGDTDGAKA